MLVCHTQLQSNVNDYRSKLKNLHDKNVVSRVLPLRLKRHLVQKDINFLAKTLAIQLGGISDGFIYQLSRNSSYFTKELM